MDGYNTIIFGHRILFRPLLHPDKTHNDVILWTDNVPLGDVKCVLVGPFNFAAKCNTILSNQFIDRNIWEKLVATCIKVGVIDSILSYASTFYNRWH